MFILPPVAQTPYAKSAFHSSVNAIAGVEGVPPPALIAAVDVPDPPIPNLATFKSDVSVHTEPFQDSV